MKRFIKMALTALCVAAIGSSVALAACSEGSQTVTISGSSSVTPLMELLAAKYEETHDVRIEINMSSSGSGIQDTQNGLNDFGMSSRLLKEEETGVKGVTLCRDGIALIVNISCATTDVTSAQVKALFSEGTAVNDEITAGIGRKEGSGTRDAFDELIDLSGYDSSVGTQDETGNVISVIESSTNSLGYISYGSLSGSSKIKALSLDGVACTIDNIKSGSYALQRPFVLVLPEGKELSGAAKDFYDYILSADAQTVITSNGYVSIY